MARQGLEALTGRQRCRWSLEGFILKKRGSHDHLAKETYDEISLNLNFKSCCQSSCPRLRESRDGNCTVEANKYSEAMTYRGGHTRLFKSLSGLYDTGLSGFVKGLTCSPLGLAAT